MIKRNYERLIAAAEALRPLSGELVYVGGAITELLVTDEGAADSRVTKDVDVIARITSYAAYSELGERLRELGFSEDTSEGAPICRWLKGEMKLDAMPTDQAILGFANHWHKKAVEEPDDYRIAADLVIRIATAPLFVAMKIEAFRDRGEGDFVMSHDLEDVVAVVDGRESLVSELQESGSEVRQYVGEQITALLETREFLDALPGHLPPDDASQDRIELVLQRLRAIAAVAT